MTVFSKPRRACRRPHQYNPCLELLEDRLVPATHIWTGALSNLWSNTGNWTGGSPAGDSQAVLSFPSAANLVNNNDLLGLTVSEIDFTGGSYTLSGNAITLVQGPSGAPRIHMDALGKNNRIAIDMGRVATTIGITVDIAGASALTVSSVISGGAAATSIVKTGPGNLILSAANTFADSVLISAGVLNIQNGSALGTTPSGETNRTTVSGGTLELQGSLFVSESFSQGAAGGTLHNVSGNSTWAGEVFLAFNDLNAQVDIFSSLTISGKIFDNSAGPSLGVTTTGFGTLALTAANTYRGVTTINAGMLNISNPSALGTGDVGTTVKNGGKLELQGFITVSAEPLVLDGAFLSNVNGNNVWQAPVTLVNSPIIDVSAGTLTMSGVIGGSTGFTVFSDDPGKLILANANTYTGSTNVLGILNIRNPLALGPAGGPSVSFGDGGTLELELQGTNSINEGLMLVGTGAGGNGALRNVSGINTWTGTVLLNFSNPAIGVSGGQLTISGPITQPSTSSLFGFGIIKVGDGALFLSANNTYTGETFINAGSLFANGSTRDVILLGGRLGGTGTVRQLVARGGVVNPGVGVGRLTSTAGVFFDPAAVFEVDLNGMTAGTSYDQLRGNSEGIFLSNNTLIARLNFFPSLSTSFRIIDNASTNPVNGTFAGLPEGAIIQTTFGSLRISYKGGTGNDVVLTAINTVSRFPDRSVTPVLDESGVALLTGTISDPDLHDVFFLEVNWGDGAPTEKHVFTNSNGAQIQLTHRYLDDNPSGTSEDVYTIQLSWHDKAGEGNSATLTPTVRNVAPEVNAGGLAELNAGAVLNRLATFTDPGQDQWIATFDYGDGSGLQTINVKGGKKFSLTHRYLQAGTYTVTVIVRDDDGDMGTASFQVLVGEQLPLALFDAAFILLADEGAPALPITSRLYGRTGSGVSRLARSATP